MWFHVPGVSKRVNSSYNALRILIIRPDMILMHSYHSLRKSGLFKTVSTMRPPKAGGFEYIARTINVSCDKTAADVDASFCTTVRLPTRSQYKPKFLAND